jgi:hypothetical protein
MHAVRISSIPKVFYFLQMIDGPDLHMWKANITWEENIKTNSNYNFNKKSVAKNSKTYNIHLELNPIESYKNFSKRMVLVEKSGCKKTPINDNDPIIKWAMQEIFPYNIIKNTRDFVLKRTNEKFIIDKTWLLTECSLIDAEIWRKAEFMPHSILKDMRDNLQITIEPKSTLPLLN